MPKFVKSVESAGRAIIEQPMTCHNLINVLSVSYNKTCPKFLWFTFISFQTWYFTFSYKILQTNIYINEIFGEYKWASIDIFTIVIWLQNTHFIILTSYVYFRGILYEGLLARYIAPRSVILAFLARLARVDNFPPSIRRHFWLTSPLGALLYRPQRKAYVFWTCNRLG